MIAFEKCAEANEASSNEWHAGKHLETCAQLAKDVGTPADIAAYAERSCAAYCTAGRSQTGAEVGSVAAAPSFTSPALARRCVRSEKIKTNKSTSKSKQTKRVKAVD